MNNPKLNNPAHQGAEVCVLTARGMAAIASIALVGDGAAALIERLFGKQAPSPGTSIFGIIRTREAVIDSAVAGCERPGCYVIHCHGNPLLAERIAGLCQDYGAVRQSPEDFLHKQLQCQCHTQIEAEARFEMTRAATLEGVSLLAGQISGGLSAWATDWLNTKSFKINQLKIESEAVLNRFHSVKRILKGVRIVLAGPPNSGKSTLLNWLAADRTALVSDRPGTTRDWVSTVCRIGPLRAEVVDTAGLDEWLAGITELDRAAQESAIREMQDCDMVLDIQDCKNIKSTQRIVIAPETPVLTVYTKSDLLGDKSGFSPDCVTPWVLVSASANDGLESLAAAIIRLLGADNIVPKVPVCFTARQCEGLETILLSKTQQSAIKGLASLLGRSEEAGTSG